MVAPFSISTSVIGVRKLFRKTVSSVGSILSEMVVKARMSQNRMVSSRFSPPSTSACGIFHELLTMAGDEIVAEGVCGCSGFRFR